MPSLNVCVCVCACLCVRVCHSFQTSLGQLVGGHTHTIPTLNLVFATAVALLAALLSKIIRWSLVSYYGDGPVDMPAQQLLQSHVEALSKHFLHVGLFTGSELA